MLLTTSPWLAFADGSASAPEPTRSALEKPPSLPTQSPPSDASGDARAKCATDLAGRVQAYYESVKDFRARFRQVTRSVTLGDASLGSDAPSVGTVQLAKPGKMRWVYETPEPSLLVSDGHTMWLYDPGAGEVQRLPVMEGVLTGAALEFMLGDGKLLESFDVAVSACEPESDGRIAMALVPREPASYERLGMRVEPMSGEIAETTILDLFGNETRIAFSEMQTNLGPADDQFQFEPPRGAQVIDLVPVP